MSVLYSYYFFGRGFRIVKFSSSGEGGEFKVSPNPRVRPILGMPMSIRGAENRLADGSTSKKNYKMVENECNVKY